MKMARPGPGGDGVARRMADAGGSARGVRSSSERIVRNAGFTLTEVLVVTLIVGVLFSFIVSAAFSALTRGHEFAIQSEAGKLALAMETFRHEYGGYPPANLAPPQGSDPDRLYSFVSRTFPLYMRRLATDDNLPGSLQEKLRNDLGRPVAEGGKGIHIHTFDPGQALVFWLAGFSTDAGDPFAGHRERMLGDDSSAALYTFADRLGSDDTDATLTVHYYPELTGGVSSASINQVAFLYFDRSAYDAEYTAAPGLQPFSAYRGPSGALNPGRFQIINAGLDRKLGSGGASRGGDDADNVAHFSSRMMGDVARGD